MFDVRRRRCTDGARVLVVEDSDDLRRLMQFTLEGEGYSVDSVDSAEEGLRLVRSRRYDLLLTDFSLPGNSGIWLLQQARSHLEDTPTLLVTGEPNAPEIGDDIAVFAKPVDFGAFLPLIRDVIADTCRGRADGGVRPPVVDLVLYVSPHSALSARAARIMREFLSRHNDGRVRCTICDVTEHPDQAAAARVVFTPALVKRSPAPPVWILGGLTDPEGLERILDLCGLPPGSDPRSATRDPQSVIR